MATQTSRPALRRLPLPRSLGTTFQSLDNPAFARFFLGTSAFFFAMNMQIMLRGWLVYILTKDPFALGVINAAFAIPTLLASPFAGVVADRVDRRKVIVISQAVQLLLAAVTTVLVLTDTITYWHLVTISVLMATSGSFNMPARQAIVPDLVGKDRLMNAIALNSGSMNVSRIAAPALAGLLVAPIGIGGGFVVTVVFYALAVFLFSGVGAGVEESAPRPRTGIFKELAEGVAYLRGARLVLLLLLASMLPMLLAMPAQILLPAFADVWHTDAAGIGIIQAAGGIGGLVGAIIAANLNNPRRPALLMTSSLVLFGAFLVAFALSPSLWPALVMIAIADVAAMLGMTINSTAVQQVIPDEVRGRVMALMMTTFGLTPLGVLPASALARLIGVQATVAAGGLLLVAFALAIHLLSTTYRSLDGGKGTGARA